jgi:hypothetical protein
MSLGNVFQLQSGGAAPGGSSVRSPCAVGGLDRRLGHVEDTHKDDIIVLQVILSRRTHMRTPGQRIAKGGAKKPP